MVMGDEDSELFPSGWSRDRGGREDDEGQTITDTKEPLLVEVTNGTQIACMLSPASLTPSFTIYANRPIPRPETAGSTLYYWEVEFSSSFLSDSSDGHEEGKEEGATRAGSKNSRSSFAVGIGLARGSGEGSGDGQGQTMVICSAADVTLATGVVPGEYGGSISYYCGGTLKRGESGTGLEPALEVPYGAEYGATDRVGCGWDVGKGTVFFTLNGSMMGLAASEYGLDHHVEKDYYPVIGIVGGSSPSRVVVKCRFPLGFSSFQALALETEEALLQGRHFGWSMLTHNDHVMALTDDLVKRTGVPVEAFERFIGNLERVDVAGGGDLASPDTEAELEQLRVGMRLLEAVLKPGKGEVGGYGSGGEDERMAAQDTHLVRSVVARCRAMQKALERQMERAMTDPATSMTAAPEKNLSRLLDLNGQLNKIYARMEAQKERTSGLPAPPTETPALPNMFSLICTVRSGSRSEKYQAAVTLASLAQNEKCREEVLAAGGLHSLVHCINSASDFGWPDVEYQAAKAVARLVPAVKDLSHLVKYSQGILGALRIVLLRDPCETGSPQRSLQSRFPLASEDERLSQRRLMVASALAHLAITMRWEWSPSAGALFHMEGGGVGGDGGGEGGATGGGKGKGRAKDSTPTIPWRCSGRDPPEKPLDALVSLVVELCSRPNRVQQGGAFGRDRQQLLLGQSSDGYTEDSISRENSGASISGGSCGSSSNAMEVDEATLLSACAVSHLAGCEGCRVLLVNYRILPTLVSWLASSNRELQRHAACAVASLCSRPDAVTSITPDLTDLPASSRSLDVYTCGWIDAQILAEGTVTHLLPLANSEELEVRIYLAKALDNLSTHPQNRGTIVSAGGIGSLVLLLNKAITNLEEESTVAQHALASLFHLAMGTDAETAEVTESSCYLIAKEGGLYPLVSFLEVPRGPLRLSAVSTIAMMTQHAPVRLAIFQANALQSLLAVGYSVDCGLEGLDAPEALEVGGSRSEAAAVAASRREEARMAKTEAIHVAYGLANLAHTQDAAKSYERRMIQAGAIPVLLHLSQCHTTEVVHQAMRALARLCGSLVRGFLPSDIISVTTPSGTMEKMRPVKSVEETHDEQLRLLQANETLRTVLGLLPSHNPYVQLEAVRALAVLAKVDDFRVHVVKCALKDLLRLAVDSSGERELRAVSQEALVSLGFEGGAKDLEFCGNDYSLLLHWFEMERALEDQKMAIKEVQFALQTITSEDFTALAAPASTQGSHPHRLTATALPSSHHHATHMGEGGRGGAAGGSLSGAVKQAVRRVVDGQDVRLRDLLCLTRPVTDSNDRDEEWRLIDAVPVATAVTAATPPSTAQQQQGRSPATGATAKETLLSFLGYGPRATSSGGKYHGPPGGDEYYAYDYDMLGGSGGDGGATPGMVRRRSSGSGGGFLPGPPAVPYSPYAGPLAVPEAGSLSFNLQKVLDRYFPSRLQQRELIPLTLYTGADFRPFRKPEFRALLMPSRRYFSFRREGRVVGRIVKKYLEEGCDFWALSFSDSSYAGEFSSSLLERLHLLPKVKSLSFSARTGSHETMETDLAYLVGNLPVSVRHLTFDCVLSRPALQILGVVLRTKSSSSKQQTPGLALTGLAVRNHGGHLRPEDFTPLLDFLRKEGLERGMQGGSLAHGGGDSSLMSEGSGDGLSPPISKGASFGSGGSMAPSLTRSSSHLLNYRGLSFLDLSGNRLTDWGCAEVITATRFCTSIVSVDLSGNAIKTGTLFLEALVGVNGLANRDRWLQTLLLDDDQLQPRAVIKLLGALEQDRSLQTLSLSHNPLTDLKVAETLRRIMKSNRTLTDLNLGWAKLPVESGKQLLFGLLENPTMRFLRLGGNPALNGEERELIDRQLVNNRRHFFHPGRGPTVQLSPSADHQHASRTMADAEGEVRGVKRGCSCEGAMEGMGGHLSSCPDYVQTTEHYQRSFSAPMGVEEVVLGDMSGGGGGPGVLMVDREGERLWHGRPDGGMATVVSGSGTGAGGRMEGDTRARRVLLAGGDASKDVSSSLALEVDFAGEQGGRLVSSPVAGKATQEDERVGSLLKEQKGSVAAEAWGRGDVLSVLFSAPLAWRDVNGHLHAIEMLEFELERELLVQSFQEAGSHVYPTFDFATTERLRTAVTLGCRALHYSGHGHKNRLTFEDGNGGLQFVSLDLLRSLCGAGEHKLEFVFVSACYSRLAGQAFAEAGVAHVVCVNVDAQLADSAALAFTKACYLALAAGSSVQDAFDIGKQAVAAAPNVANSQNEGEKFLLLPEGQDHNVAVFAARPMVGLPPRWPSDGMWEAREHLPTPPEDFVGREVDMYRTINAVLNRRLITLLGTSGIGKSALAAACAHYLALRKNLPDGIVMVRLQGKSTLEQLVQAIVMAVRRSLSSKTAKQQGGRPAAADGDDDDEGGGLLRRDEDWLFNRLRHVKVLLVLDHIEELQASQDSLDLKVFLRQLFDQTRSVKVLVTSSRPIDIHTLPGIGVGETIVSVGPLTLRNTVRLFSRLCPHLHTARDRRSFLEKLVTQDQADVTVTSREITPASLRLLERLGEGHPGRILQLAYEMSETAVLELLQMAQSLLEHRAA